MGNARRTNGPRVWRERPGKTAICLNFAQTHLCDDYTLAKSLYEFLFWRHKA
jgi:hypothetical protein